MAGKQYEKKEQTETKGDRPDLRIVQVDKDTNGETRFTNVGGAWKTVTKNGNEMYNVRIGNLRLQMYPNDKKEE